MEGILLISIDTPSLFLGQKERSSGSVYRKKRIKNFQGA